MSDNMFRKRESSFLSTSSSRLSKPATRNTSSCSTVTTATSGYGTSSTSKISEFGESFSSLDESSSSVKNINFASSAIFNFEMGNFEFETGDKLNLNTEHQLTNYKSEQKKDFLCYFGPSGSITEKCQKCGVFIKEKFVTVGDLVFHPKCLQCAKCGTELKSGTLYENDDNFYCKKDYLTLFSEICSKCGKPLDEEYVHVGEKLFHFKCFTCKECHTKLDGYMEKDGEFYCDKHYQERFSPRCGKCNKLCKDKFLRTTNGKVFHHECFKCNACGRKLKKHFISDMKYYCSEACVKKR